MTTVFEQSVNGRRLDVLVVAVGSYPNCGAAGRDAYTRSLSDLPAAVQTATAMADWFLDHHCDDTDVPLASLEMAVSGSYSYRGSPVEPPVTENVLDCFERWYRRCDVRESTALFYFVGHGCARDPYSQMLFTQDFGRRGNLFDHAIDFSGTHTAMLGCRAETQCFLIDACREIPFDYEFQRDWRGRVAVGQEPVPGGRTTDLILHSAAPGMRAFAGQGPTRFSKAVRAAFAGGAARQIDGGWAVTADGLGHAVDTIMRLERQPDEPFQEPHTVGSAASAVLRRLDELPMVPFSVDCAPTTARQAAHLKITEVRGGNVAYDQGPVHRAWRGSLQASAYDLDLRFPCGRWQDRRAIDQFVVPPAYETRIEIR